MSGKSAKYGDLDLGRVPHVTSAADFLAALNLSNLMPHFAERGLSTVEHLLHLVPADLDSMGLRLVGVRVRLLKGLSLLRDQHGSSANASSTTTPRSESDDAMTMDASMAPVESEGVRYNSTSSLCAATTPHPVADIRPPIASSTPAGHAPPPVQSASEQRPARAPAPGGGATPAPRTGVLASAGTSSRPYPTPIWRRCASRAPALPRPPCPVPSAHPPRVVCGRFAFA